MITGKKNTSLVNKSTESGQPKEQFSSLRFSYVEYEMDRQKSNTTEIHEMVAIILKNQLQLRKRHQQSTSNGKDCLLKFCKSEVN